MTHLLLLNLVFFMPGTCGAVAFAFCVYRFLRSDPPPAVPPEGGSKSPQPTAGPDDLARSA
jgi:hypothetical protein